LPYCPSDGVRFYDLGQQRASLRRHSLGVVQSFEHQRSIGDHARRDDRSRERTASNLIDAAEQPETFSTRRIFEAMQPR
jgi:hypothetical protein